MVVVVACCWLLLVNGQLLVGLQFFVSTSSLLFGFFLIEDAGHGLLNLVSGRCPPAVSFLSSNCPGVVLLLSSGRALANPVSFSLWPHVLLLSSLCPPAVLMATPLVPQVLGFSQENRAGHDSRGRSPLMPCPGLFPLLGHQGGFSCGY